MKALFWKDVRFNSQILWFGFILLVAPYAIGALWILFDRWPGGPPLPAHVRWVRMLYGASYFALGAAQLTLVLLGGYTIAGERVDRSAEFVAGLPVSRAKILVSKALVGLLVVVVVWGLNLAVAGLLRWVAEPALADTTITPSLRAVAPLLTGGLFVFGVSWMVSCFLESPTFAVGAGIGAPFLFWLGIFLTDYLWPWLPRHHQTAEQMVFVIYCIAGAVLGPLCFFIGSLYYLHRVEP
jgi:hypothetical protein